MRTVPRRNNELPLNRKDEITRKIAIAIAFVGVFIFFIKLLFF